MWRCALAAIAVYFYGHPAFDGYRPTALDQPLQSFYTDINLVARLGKQTLTGFDRDHAKQQARKFVDQVEGELKGKAP
jgi:hypothetical protein